MHARRRNRVEAGLVSAWTSPLSLFAGLFAVAICAYLAATFLIVEAQVRGEPELARDFRTRAIDPPPPPPGSSPRSGWSSSAIRLRSSGRA